MFGRRKIALGVCFCTQLVLASSLAVAQDWQQYRNERYGFTLVYPADLLGTERAAEAGDGQVFASPNDEARLLVGALPNESGFTPTTYQQYIERHSYPDYQIDYRRTGSSWFALSGEGGGRIFYEKVMFTCGGRLINSFAMVYPSAQRHIFDPVVERIEDSFKPATDCVRAGLESTPRPTTARPHRPPGVRSAMADRIARERGHDVIVVLRRTTPPYDRKILRGYVARP
jgi:hypothetical protein